MSRHVDIRIGGSGTISLFTITFVVLKLCDVIHWSWWWVLSPLWISAGFVVFVCMVAFTVYKIRNWRKVRR